MKLGKLPARPGAIKLSLWDYLSPSRVPTPPAEFGHEALVTSWPMLGNDKYGDCVWAGAAHETMLWDAEGGRAAAFADANVLSDYSAVTGFDPTRPETDAGTDMQKAAAYRKATGIVDASGVRHRVGAYLSIGTGNLDEHLTAAWLFGAVGIGVNFPASAFDQLSHGEPWDVVAGDYLDGGHYIPLICRRAGMFHCVTWGKDQPMTDAWFKQYNDESIVYLSEEFLSGGKSLEGFDLDQLTYDLSNLSRVK